MPDESMAAELIPASIKADLNALLAYNWRDEEADYYANVVEYEDTTLIDQTHIFPAMRRLNDWING